jgi:NitT/TauT family transport system ATP-binding protein
MRFQVTYPPMAPVGELAQPIASFSGISKVYPDGTKALEGTTFDVLPEEFVTIVGPSGCGKSTLLRIASNLTTPSSGSVNVSTTSIGYVFQDATLLPWRNVKKNIELFLELDNEPKEKRPTLVGDVISLVGLEGFEHHFPRQLSGGMKMRVSLARALTLKPKLFLFDEPFGALDEISRERLNEELLKLFASERFAGLFITHSVYEAVFLSTRVLVMSPQPGRITAEIDIPFDYPRYPELRHSEEFARLTGEVSEALRTAS